MVSNIIHRELGVLALAMPENQNSQGAIFGGWMMGQMDMAGTIVCRKFQKHSGVENIVTVNVTGLDFKQPVYIGDVIECWVDVIEIGTSSLETEITVKARRKTSGKEEIVAIGLFTYVNLNNGRPSEVKKHVA